MSSANTPKSVVIDIQRSAKSWATGIKRKRKTDPNSFEWDGFTGQKDFLTHELTRAPMTFPIVPSIASWQTLKIIANLPILTVLTLRFFRCGVVSDTPGPAFEISDSPRGFAFFWRQSLIDWDNHGEGIVIRIFAAFVRENVFRSHAFQDAYRFVALGGIATPESDFEELFFHLVLNDKGWLDRMIEAYGVVAVQDRVEMLRLAIQGLVHRTPYDDTTSPRSRSETILFDSGGEEKKRAASA